MFGGYWYVGPAADGRRFCWAKSPSFECPVFEQASDALSKEHEPSDQILVAATSLGVYWRWLAQRIGRTHERARVDGKLTDRCLCGARMDRLGFAYWSETPKADPVADRLGLSASERGETRYADTKREAERWARDELQIARRAEAEAS